MVCAATGVSAEVETSAGYIDNWRQALSDDTRLIVQAASKAQKAADLILAGVEGGGA
jgi:antirestriction protein ArdC